MGAMAHQITSLIIAYSAVYSDADQRKHQSSASLAFVMGIHRWLVNSPHKGLVTRNLFHLMTSSWDKLDRIIATQYSVTSVTSRKCNFLYFYLHFRDVSFYWSVWQVSIGSNNDFPLKGDRPLTKPVVIPMMRSSPHIFVTWPELIKLVFIYWAMEQNENRFCDVEEKPHYFAMQHCSDVMWAPWRLKSPDTQLFIQGQQQRTLSELHLTGLCLVNRWPIPSQRVSNG